MAFPPRAFIIGAQKAGTTSLAELLDAQPGIRLSEPKETEFFTRHYARGLDWYRGCFAGATDELLIDADTGYSAAPTARFPRRPGETDDPVFDAARRIHAHCPDARFLYLLRDPAARSYSAYWHNVRAGWEKRPFRVALDQEPGYHRISDYAGQLRIYLDLYPPERFLLLSFETFTAQPESALRACCEHLGVACAGMPAGDGQHESGHRNKSFQFSGGGHLLQRLAGSTRNLERLVRLGRAIIPRHLHATVQGWLTRDIPRMSEADRAWLNERYAGWREELDALPGLARWGFDPPPRDPPPYGPAP